MNERRVLPIAEPTISKGGQNFIAADSDGYVVVGPRPPAPMGSDGKQREEQRKRK